MTANFVLESFNFLFESIASGDVKVYTELLTHESSRIEYIITANFALERFILLMGYDVSLQDLMLCEPPPTYLARVLLFAVMD